MLSALVVADRVSTDEILLAQTGGVVRWDDCAHFFSRTHRRFIRGANLQLDHKSLWLTFDPDSCKVNTELCAPLRTCLRESEGPEGVILALN